jgi:hypothetical protein
MNLSVCGLLGMILGTLKAIAVFWWNLGYTIVIIISSINLKFSYFKWRKSARIEVISTFIIFYFNIFYYLFALCRFSEFNFLSFSFQHNLFFHLDSVISFIHRHCLQIYLSTHQKLTFKKDLFFL